MGTEALTLALTAGVLAVHSCAALPGAAGLAAAAIPAFLPWRLRALWAAVVLGALLAAFQAQHRLDERWPASRHGEEIEVSGHIASLVERLPGRPGESGSTLRFDFVPDDAALPGHVRATWYRSDAEVRGGACWRLRLKMRTPHGSLDPGASDYEGWLYRQGIGATATVRDGAPCPRAPSDPVLAMRQAIVDRLQGWLPDRRQAAMAAALAVGDESGFSDSDWTVFRRTGTSHLVAISGFNIAIVAGVAYFLVRWLWPLVPGLALRFPAQKAGFAAGAVAGLLDSLLAGWGSPAQRSAFMLVALFVAALADRRGHPWRVLALVWAAMLAADPAQVLAPGLWLSFGAVAAIYFLTGARLGRIAGWRLAIRLQVMLSVVLAPLTLFFFHGASWPGPLVNLVAVPAMAVLTPVLLASMLVAWLVPAAGVPLVHLAGGLLGWLQSGFAIVAAAAPGAWMPANPPVAALALALFGAVLLFAPRGWPLAPLGLACLVPLLVPPRTPVRGPFDVTALDVGQGLAVVVRTPHHTLLYDAGPAFDEGFDAGESIVVPFLLRQSGRRLDRLLLSHGDADHAGGVPAVRRGLDVRGEIGTPHHRPCVDGVAWTWDDVQFDVLHPAGDPGSDNDRSCVLRVHARTWTVLLAADIEKAAEERLLREHPDELRADVLIAPHHGSRTSSTPAFVAAVAPRIVVFSAGWRSPFGHPRPEVVARYRAIGALTVTTGVEGAVHLERDDDGAVRARTWRREAAHFWNAAPEP